MIVEPEEQPETLAPRVYAALVGILLCLGAIPFMFWLGDQRLIPWANEARWFELRRQSTSMLPAIAATDRIELRRDSCFGTCPVYKLVLFASGRVEFAGEMFVCAVGPHIAQVDAKAATELIADLSASGYFDLAWKPGYTLADAATVHTRLTVGSKSRSIEREHEDQGAPRILEDMERSIDEVAGTERWLAKREGYKPYCLTPDGKRTHWLRSQSDTLASPGDTSVD